jgi:hypothetical protein
MRLHSLLSCAKLLSLAALASACAIVPAAAQKGERPCDLFAAATPCVAAHSTTRALYSSYKGPLYEVTRTADNKTTDIGLLPDGYANAAAQDAFCTGAGSCTITKLYDQSPKHNDLTLAPPGGAAHGKGPGGHDVAVIADAQPITVNGHKVYGMKFEPGMGYRNDHVSGTATGTQAEGVYMLTSALHVNHKCCFDYGNAETNDRDNKHGHMDAMNIKCTGRVPKGEQPTGPCNPLAGLDMEDGIPGKFPVPGDTMFATVMGANDGHSTYAIYQGNATGQGKAGALTSTGTIPLPPQYQPMKLEGAIILGIGGDNSNWDEGYFFEGVMTIGAPTAQSMATVQGNIVSAHYAGDLKD